MTVQVIATAYGGSALRVLRDVVREAKSGDPMAPVTLLVPNNLAGIVARRHLAQGLRHDDGGVAGISLATLPRLAEQLAANGLAPRTPTTGLILASAWRAALEQAPGVFGAVLHHPATIRALVAAHRELRDLTPVALDRVASASALTADLVRLHRAVTAALEADWYDTTDLLRSAAGRVGADPRSTAELGRVVLYLPQELTLAESALASALSGQAPMTVVLGMTDVKRGDESVLRSMGRMGVTLDRPQSRPRVAGEVLHASDSDDEVRCVVRDVVTTLGSVPAHRVAVLYGSTHPYARLLQEHFVAAGVTVNGAGTRPVDERALGRGFLDVLLLAAEDVPRAAFFTAISEAPTLTFEGGQVPVTRWERLSRTAAVVGGDDWRTRLETYAAALVGQIAEEQGRDDSRDTSVLRWQRELEAVEGLRSFAAGLRDRLRLGAALSTWSELGSWALGLFAELYGDAKALARLPAEEQYAAVTVEAALRGLAGLDAFEPTATLDGLVEVLTLELESALPRVGRFGEGVLVAPLSAAVGLDVDVVYVVGLAEDAYPGRLREDALLLEHVRDLAGGELASYRDRLHAQHRQLLAAFDAAPRVVASFPRGDLRRSTQRLPSRWLLWTLRELTGNAELAATEWESASSDQVRGSASFASSLQAVPMPASEQEWRARSAAAGAPLYDPVVDAGRDVVVARSGRAFTRFDGNLAGAQGLPDFADGRRLVSPTQLERYAYCPHAYFVERLLGVSQVEQPEEIIAISALDIGSLMHETMDAFITDCAATLPGYGMPWTAEHHMRLGEIASAKALEFEQRGSTGHQRLWQTERDRILADLGFMLDDDTRRRAERGSRVLRSELTFGSDGADPVAIEVERGTVLMRGSADKVDQAGDGTLIVIDIKTGSMKSFAALHDDPVAAGLKLQLPVYANAALQLLGGERAEAAYWFVRQGKRGWIDLALTAEVQDVYASAVGTLVASIAGGLFPARAPAVPDWAWVQCPYCNPDGLGHGEVRARWERQRDDPLLHDLVGLIEPAGIDTDDAPGGGS